MAKKSFCPGVLWSLCWLLLLLFIAWPIAFAVCAFYVLFSPFAPCIPIFKCLTDVLLQGVQLPLTCATNMVNMEPLCQ